MTFTASRAEFDEGDTITVIDELGSSYTGAVTILDGEWYLDGEYRFVTKENDKLCLIIPSDSAEISGFVREIRDIEYLD